MSLNPKVRPLSIPAAEARSAGRGFAFIEKIRILIETRRGCRKDAAIAKFHRAPLAFLYDQRGRPHTWPTNENRQIGYTEAFVVVDGQKLARIELVLWSGTNARIGHFAVERGFEGRGIGTKLAQAFAQQLAARYGINRIRFSESHKRFHEAGYEAFFHAIGATPLPISDRQQRTDQHDYEWLPSAWHGGPVREI